MMGQPEPYRARHNLHWPGMGAEERSRQYSPSSCLPGGDLMPYIRAYRTKSDQAWAHLERSPTVETQSISYGAEASRTVDVAVPFGTSAPPLVVYLHGGYWQELSKYDSRFAASDAVSNGWAFAAVDYTLAPNATIAEMVTECDRAIQLMVDDAPTLGIDPDRVYLAGSSAGAHLAALVALGRQAAAAPISGVVLISGIYELAPLVGTYIAEPLQLDDADVAALSPLRSDLGGFPPAVLAYGDNETSEFKAQSEAFAEKLSVSGSPVTVLECPGRNHFDLPMDLADQSTPLGAAVATLINQ